MPLCLLISTISYTKIFRTFGHYQAQEHDHVHQEPNLPNALNITRYKKAVYSALWAQLALVFCFVSISVVEIVMVYSKSYPSHLVVIREVAISFVYFNSTLNPSLY